MIRLKVNIILILFFLSSISIGKAQKDEFGEEEIISFFNSFTESIKNPDFINFESYISENSINYFKNRFPIGYNGYLYSLNELNSIFVKTELEFELKKIEQNTSYIIISGEWISSNEKVKEKFKKENTKLNIDYHLIIENDSIKIIHPFELYKNLWNCLESKYYIFYFDKDVDIEKHLKQIDEMDNHIKYLCDLFDYKINNKILFYKCNNLIETKILNQFKSYDGLVCTENNAIISTSFKQFHEPVHLISEKE